jgi:hypothetical protein
MGILKYVRKISKITNVAFGVMWGTSLLMQFISRDLLDWRIAVLNLLLMPISYLVLVLGVMHMAYKRKIYNFKLNNERNNSNRPCPSKRGSAYNQNRV